MNIDGLRPLPKLRLTLEWLPSQGPARVLYLRTGTLTPAGEWDTARGLLMDLTAEVQGFELSDSTLPEHHP